MYRYRATKDGYLNDPHGYVEVGKVITSSVPIKASWLAPLEGNRVPPLEPEKPLMPKMNVAGSNVKTVNHPEIDDPTYTQAMEGVIRQENLQDGIEPTPANASVDAEPASGPIPAIDADGNRLVGEAYEKMHAMRPRIESGGQIKMVDTNSGDDAQEGTGNQDVI